MFVLDAVVAAVAIVDYLVFAVVAAVYVAAAAAAVDLFVADDAMYSIAVEYYSPTNY